MKPTAPALLALAALLAPAAAGAHGVSVEVDRRDGAVAARARYEGGRPLAGARFEVVSPAHPERAFEAGRTDRHGWLVFVPDAPGTWRVRIADASGHGGLAAVEVLPASQPPAAPAPPVPGDENRDPLALRQAQGERTSSGGSPSASEPPPAAPATALPAPLRTALGAAALALAFAALFLVHRRRRGGR